MLHKFFPNLPGKKPADSHAMDVEDPVAESHVPWVEK